MTMYVARFMFISISKYKQSTYLDKKLPTAIKEL